MKGDIFFPVDYINHWTEMRFFFVTWRCERAFGFFFILIIIIVECEARGKKSIITFRYLVCFRRVQIGVFLLFIFYSFDPPSLLSKLIIWIFNYVINLWKECWRVRIREEEKIVFKEKTYTTPSFRVINIWKKERFFLAHVVFKRTRTFLTSANKKKSKKCQTYNYEFFFLWATDPGSISQ